MRRTAAALAVGLLAGCSGGDSLTESDLRRLVLQPADLGGFQRFDEGPQRLADARPGARSDPGRFGREGGWKARFRRGGAGTTGPLVVESRVDLFGDDGGAGKELAAARREHAAVGALRPTIGDEATGSTVLEPGLNDVRSFTVEWRQGRVVASITANGFDKRIALEDVLALARKQAQRIDAAD